ncbi:hypothetical protein [Cereibacter sphaeroides]|uniref:hypothetical protein n=2 Tax=Bacteria TaxID=2 RepID=UPI0002F2A6B5|nr:hypothetical protein [Cereibacter sphaeroides]
MKMPDHLDDLKNQFRGIISSVRSSGFRKHKASEALAHRYWSALQKLLLSARVMLQPDQYQEFVEWLTKQEAAVLPEIKRSLKGYEQLSGIANSKQARLETEVLWSTALLTRYKKELIEFRRTAELVTQHVLSDEFVCAIQCVDDLERQFGISLWSVQLRIALTNEAYGLEAQKKVVEEARSAFDRGLLGYVAYFCGVRNESRTTAERFSVNTAARIAKHRFFSKEVKAYLRFVLVGEIPASAAGLSNLIRVSQSHHFFDHYETCIAALQTLCMEAATAKPLIDHFVSEFKDINDFRIAKLAIAVSPSQSECEQDIEENRVLNAILDPGNSHALMTAARIINTNSALNPWDYIYTGWITSEGTLKEPKEKRVSRRCVRFISATFTPTQLFDPHDAIVKLSRNFGQLPFFQALWTYSRLVNKSTLLGPEEHREIGLNCPTFGFEDLRKEALLRHVAISDFPNAGIQSSADFWRAYSGIHANRDDTNSIVALAFALGNSARESSTSFAEQDELPAVRCSKGARRHFLDLAVLSNAVSTHNRQTIIDLLARSCSFAAFSPFRHKIAKLLGSYEWLDFQHSSDPVLRSVAIHLAWEAQSDPRLRSALRFSVKQFFKDQPCPLPSQLDWSGSHLPQHVIVYFLYRVCSLDVLDILKELRGSRQVLAERVGICSKLQTIDPDNRSVYAIELVEVQGEISLFDGQLIVDSSRIYVETLQLRQWAKANLAEDYSRYLDLAELDIEHSRPFDELLGQIRKKQRDNTVPFSAESEADILLYSILHRLRDEFLTNSAFGLDFFLSKRIRHQSFVGSIRAPLELEELITNRSSEGADYKPNYKWVNKLAVSGSMPREALLSAFDNFSAAFDKELIEAKNRRLQIQGKENPNGLIFLPLTANVVELTKALTRNDRSFDGFVDAAIALMWVGLEPALAITRSFIKEELKNRLIGSIIDLRTRVKDALGNSREFLEFDATIGRRSSEVQVKLDECADWFSHTNLDYAGKTFALDDAVSMAQKFALDCLPGFSPAIERTHIDHSTRILAPSLVHLHDLILIALQNAKDHSGLKSPRTVTSALVDADRGVLVVRVESEIKSAAKKAAKEGAAERKRLIADGVSKFQTRKEGGSGFFKLAAVAAQSDKGRLDFGVTADGMFFLEMQYSLILEAAN